MLYYVTFYFYIFFIYLFSEIFWFLSSLSWITSCIDSLILHYIAFYNNQHILKSKNYCQLIAKTSLPCYFRSRLLFAPIFYYNNFSMGCYKFSFAFIVFIDNAMNIYFIISHNSFSSIVVTYKKRKTILEALLCFYFVKIVYLPFSLSVLYFLIICFNYK